MFELTKEQAMLQKMVREFATNEVEPIAEQMEKDGHIPADLYKKFGETGLLSLNIPKEYGGAGMDDICKVLAVMEVARADASAAEFFAVQLLVNYILATHANEEQKKKYFALPKQGKIGAFALTEPEAGSDAGGLQMTAEEDGDSYILNGSKVFISNMGENEGEFALVFALTDKAKKNRGGVTAFIVDRDTPGFKLGKFEDKMGLRACAVSELIFEDCRVPKSQILGVVGKGFNVAMSGLDSGRIGIASQACGEAQAALDEAVTYAKQRQQFGKPIATKQGLQWYLAEMATKLEAAKLLTLKAAALMTAGKRAVENCSMAKFYAAETANEICAKAIQIHGYEGTSDVQKIVISRGLLK